MITFDGARVQLKVIIDNGIRLIGCDVQKALLDDTAQLLWSLVRQVEVEGYKIA